MKLVALILPLTLSAADWKVDQPSRWYDPEASHHGKHALILGAPVAVISYVGLRIVGFNRPVAFVGGSLAASAAGVVYELNGAADGAYRDPVDVAWTALGGIVAAGLCWSGEAWYVAPRIGRETAAIEWQVKF